MKTLSVLLFVTFGQFAYSQSIDTFFVKAMDKINSIKCYKSKIVHSNSKSYDTLLSYRGTWYDRVEANPSDSIFGSNFKSYFKDTTQIDLDYRDNIEVWYNWDKKTIRVDTIDPTAPFVSNSAPVIFRLKALIRYVSSHIDSVEYSFKDLQDSMIVDVLIRHKLVEFHNLKGVEDSSSDTLTSAFTVWLTKDYLPYRWKQWVPHQMVMDQITFLSINNCDTAPHGKAGVYMPEGFVFEVPKNQELIQKEIVGQQVGSWSLKNVEGDIVNFSDFKGKVLLIEFTGVGCGPCGLALPLLEKLDGEYKDRPFKLVSIEIWEDDINLLKKYLQSQKVNHEYLISPSGSLEQYKKFGIPIFLIVDKNSIVQKVFWGYEGGKRDNEIRGAILSQLN